MLSLAQAEARPKPRQGADRDAMSASSFSPLVANAGDGSFVHDIQKSC
jgi:hypothetical protein